MTLEGLKKHAKPLVWEEQEERSNAFLPLNCIDKDTFIYKGERGAWFSYADIIRSCPTKEEAMQHVEEYHLRKLAKFFDLEDETEQQS